MLLDLGVEQHTAVGSLLVLIHLISPTSVS